MLKQFQFVVSTIYPNIRGQHIWLFALHFVVKNEHSEYFTKHANDARRAVEAAE